MQELDCLMNQRPDLSAISGAQLAPLEALFAPEWPQTWRDLCRSHYITLLHLAGQPDAAQAQHLARQALALTRGLAQDLGGQPVYIPVGVALCSAARAQRVAAALRQGASYASVARAERLTERRVRQIEAAWRAAEMQKRQGRLPL